MKVKKPAILSRSNMYMHAWLWHFACMFWTLYHFCQLKWFKSVHAYLISLWDCVNPCSIKGRSLSTNLYFAKCEMYIMCNRIFFFKIEMKCLYHDSDCGLECSVCKVQPIVTSADIQFPHCLFYASAHIDGFLVRI